jgi:hypothetical protein
MTKFTSLQLMYFKQKGRIPVLEATEQAFKKVPETFSGSDLQRHAARLICRPAVYHDTILRCMRVLKKRGRLNYSCIDQVNSIYRKEAIS